MPALDGTDPAGTSDYYELAGQAGLFVAFRPRNRGNLALQPDYPSVLVDREPAEVFEKARYIDSSGLAGASVWALEGDSQNALTSALTAGLQQGSSLRPGP